MPHRHRFHPDRLMDAVPVTGGEQVSGLAETAWIEVIKKMDEVYSDLIRYEVDLERKNAALEQTQQFIASVVASMSDILVVCDPKGRILQVNPALLGLTGFTAAELIDQPLTALLRDEDVQGFRPCYTEAVCEREARLKSKHGGFTGLVAMNCAPRLDRQRRLPGMVIVGRPVGELRRAYEELNRAHDDLKRAQQQLIQSEKMASIGRLVAGVAHELNNPISFIYGNVHTLARYRDRLVRYLGAVHAGAAGEELAELRREMKIDDLLADLGSLIEGTQEGAERVSEIVTNLRRLSFVNPSERTRINLTEVARNAIKWVLKATRQQIAVDDQLPVELLIDGIEGPLHQVMVNLVQNAVDAMEDVARPALWVSGRQLGDQILLVLRDNGPGIPTDHLLKVFDPFYTTKAVGKGTGLGLWVSWSIIRDHGGALEAANAPDGGAAFTITLPTR